MQTRRFWLGLAFGITALAILVLMLLSSQNEAASEGNTRFEMTISPLFDDPRLSTPLETVTNEAINGTVPANDLRMIVADIQNDLNETEGVQNCSAYILRMDAISANCTVEVGFNRVEMAEVLRLLAFRRFEPAEFSATLTDDNITTTYVWESILGYWGVRPERHPTFDDPRLSLVIAYNPPPNLDQTVTAIPATPDPRPPIERIQAFFNDTPHIETCYVLYSYEAEQGYWYGRNQQVDADCVVEDGYNSLEMAEWLRRLANRAFIRGNIVSCEDMSSCNAQLNQVTMTLVLRDSEGSTQYFWDSEAEYWTVSEVSE